MLQQIPPVFVWSWPLCTVHYDISLDSIVSVLHTGNMIQLLTHVSYGFLAKNQMLDQALQWIRIPGIVHLNPDEPEIMLCWKSDVCRYGCTCDQWMVFHSTWDKFCLGGLAMGANATPVLHTYYGDTTAQSQYKDRLSQVWGLPC